MEDVTRSTEFLGRIQAIQSVDIRARVEGFLQEVHFREGQDVQKGDLLYVIEPAQYRAALNSAKAQLQSAQAGLVQAEQNLKRQQELRKRGTVAQATLDQAVAQRDTAAANVTAAQAGVETAQLNLGYTRVATPIDGRIGATAATVGNLVGPTSGVLATVVQLDPIRVVFSVNERDLLAVKRRSTGVPQQAINARFVPTLRLSDGTMYPRPGNVEFVDNRVDPQTGTIAVYADFPNPDKLLLPGMLVTVLVRPEQPRRAIVVPIAAVQQDRTGPYVLVVDADGRVAQRRIEIEGQSDGSDVVKSGLREGENVIVQGLQKVRPGQTVKAVPEAAPPAGDDQPAPAAQPAPPGR
jgi:membrane fusion protein (multidrug efflux system)